MKSDRRPLLALVVGAALSSGAAAAADGPGPTAVPAAAVRSEAAASPAAQPAATPTPTATPEPAWLMDDQGRKYRIDRLTKSYPHERLEGSRLRTVWGMTVDLAGEDEKDFFVKIYRTSDAKTGPPVAKGPTDAEVAAVVASYAFDLPASRKLAFERFDDGLPQEGQWRDAFVLADMNGDGILDIVHGPARKRPGPPAIFLGDGKGHWRRFQEAVFPRARYDYGAIVVADFNGDGHPDLAMGMHLLGMTALTGDGAGKFQTANKGMDPIGAGGENTAFSSHALLALDWDGDGRVDLIALGEGPKLRPGRGGLPDGGASGIILYRNLGNGAWEKKPSRSKAFGDDLAAGRLANGKLFFVSATSIHGLQEILHVQGGDPWTDEPLPGLRPGSLVRSAAVADFDRDGHDDIALGYAAYEGGAWRTGIDLFFQRPGKGWERRTLFVTSGSKGFTALAAGDLNHDGLPDLVGLTGDATMKVFLNAGRGKFTGEAADLHPSAPSCRGYHVAVADLDGDGYGDIVASFAGENEGMGGLVDPGCPAEGSLRAWKTIPAK